MTRATPLVLTVLVGCSAAGLSEHEAQDTFEVVNVVTNDVVLLTRDAVEQGAGSLKVDLSGAGADFSGVATGGTGWTGTATLDGSVSADGDYVLTVTYDEVSQLDGPTIDGELTLAFWAEEFGTADFAWTLHATVDGWVEVSGEANGSAELDYELTLTIDGWSVELTAEGTLAGYDVSGWSFSLSLF
ncbi:MAG: hypothetical protein ABMA64_15890 [Myxococcota bacterium]